MNVARAPIPIAIARPAGAGRAPVIAHRLVALAATAALVLVTMGIGFVAFQQRYFTGISDDPPGVTDELLVRAEGSILPVETSTRVSAIERMTIDPGARVPVNNLGDYDDGVFLIVVESGTIELAGNGQIGVIRAGDPADAITAVDPGNATALAAGDRAIVPSGVEAAWTNTGAEPAIVLCACLSTGATSDEPGTEWAVLASSFKLAWPAGPATIELHRITLDPAAELPLAELPDLAMLAVDSGAIDAPLGTDEAPRTREFDAGEGLVPIDWGLRAGGALRNNGDVPAVLYVMTVTSTAGTPTP